MLAIRSIPILVTLALILTACDRAASPAEAVEAALQRAAAVDAVTVTVSGSVDGHHLEGTYEGQPETELIVVGERGWYRTGQDAWRSSVQAVRVAPYLAAQPVIGAFLSGPLPAGIQRAGDGPRVGRETTVIYRLIDTGLGDRAAAIVGAGAPAAASDEAVRALQAEAARLRGVAVEAEFVVGDSTGLLHAIALTFGGPSQGRMDYQFDYVSAVVIEPPLP
jgi:hypothetical protein